MKRCLTPLCLTVVFVFLPTQHSRATAQGWSSRNDIRWMITPSALDTIDTYLHSTTLTKDAFDNTRTNELGKLTQGWSALPTTVYKSEQAFATAVASENVPTSWVAYDNENWQFTPKKEQQNPGWYMKEFVRLARQYRPPKSVSWHRLHVILAPANDLVRSMSCYVRSDPDWRNYLIDCQLPALAAEAHPDAFEIQAQRYENSTGSSGTNCGCYVWFVRQAATKARAHETRLTALAGLSTNPAGQVSTGKNLYRDSLGTQKDVQGYWLNIPKQSQSCPTCSPDGDPKVAVDYLHDLGY